MKKRRPDICGNTCERAIRRTVASEKVAMLIGGFPNANPSSPEVYTGMMIEETIAARPLVSAMEATCREIRRRDKPFPPTPGEFLKVLEEQQERWWGQIEVIKSFLGYLNEDWTKIDGEWSWELQESVASAKQALITQEEKARVAKAKAEAAAARRRAEQEAEAACKQAEADEAHWKSQEVGEAMLHGIGQQSAREDVALQDSLKKIKDAFTTGELIAMVSCAIALFEERRKLRAWERESEAELEAEMRVQDFYNYGGTAALKSSRSLEEELKNGAAWTAIFEDACRVSFALGVFEMRRELCAWRQAWARNRFGLPIWA
jgi:hypothetical protein